MDKLVEKLFSKFIVIIIYFLQDAARFAYQIEKAFADMKKLLLERKKVQQHKNGST